MLKLYAMKEGILGYDGDSDDSIVARLRQKKARGKQKTNGSLTPDNSHRIYTAVQSLFWITYGLMFAFASLYLQNRGFSNSRIGLTLGCSYGLSAIMQPVLSRLFIRFHVPTEKAICRIYGVAIVFAVFLLFAPATNSVAGVMLVVIFALESSLQPCMDTLARRWTDLGCPVNFGASRGIGSLLYAGMTAGMGMLLQRVTPAVIPAFYIGSMSLTALILLRLRIPGAMSEEDAAERKTPFGFGSVIRKPFFLPLLCGISCLSFGHVLTDNFMLQIMQNIGGDSHDLGIAIAVASLVEFPAMCLFSRINRRIGEHDLLMISAWAWFAKNILILLANRPEIIYIAETLQFCSYGLYIPAIVQFVARVFPGRGNLIGQAFVGCAYTTGSVIATFLGGKLLDAVGISTTLLVIAVVTLTGAILFTVSTRFSRVILEARCVSHGGDK